MKHLIAVAVLALVSACAILPASVTGDSPESQIVNGSNSVRAASVVGSTLLKNGKITVSQSKGYSAILHSASDHLHAAASTLDVCRKATSSTAKSNPDPCRAGIAADISLAVSVVSEVQKTLKAKE